MDEKGNFSQVVDFHLLDAKQDYMLTVEQFQYRSNILRLRKISDMSIVHDFMLSYSFPVDGYKLIGSIDWDHYFGLAIKTKRTSYDLENDGKLLLYQV